MTKKRQWNIWRIKTPLLRALFTFTIMTPLLGAVVVITAFISICAGIGEGVAYGWHVFRWNSDVKRMWSNYWRAVAFKESP